MEAECLPRSSLLSFLYWLELQLQCKYDCLRARMKTSDGVELTAEFYLDQMKSQREEIQKKGLDLSEKLRKVITFCFLFKCSRITIDHHAP